jgi:uncharacterized membrane protein
MQRQFPVATRLAFLLTTAIACSSDETTGLPESIQIAVSSPSISVQCGATSALTASIRRIGGFAGPVALSVSDLPDGVSITLSPEQLTGAGTTTTLHMVVAHSAVPGSYTITITASASIAEATTSYVLTIIEAPDFVLSAQTELSVVGGNAVSTTIQITRLGGLTGTVSLSLADPIPWGIQGAFQPSSTTGNSSTLTLSVATIVAAGRYLITVNGASGQLTARSVTIALTVTYNEPPGFELVVEPSALTVKAGGTVVGNVTLIPHGGYDRYADLSLVSPPAGIAAVFEWYYGWVAAMVISVDQTVTPGTYQLTLKGTAQVGTYTDTVPFTLTVTEAGDFVLVLTPTVLSMDRIPELERLRGISTAVLGTANFSEGDESPQINLTQYQR